MPQDTTKLATEIAINLHDMEPALELLRHHRDRRLEAIQQIYATIKPSPQARHLVDQIHIQVKALEDAIYTLNLIAVQEAQLEIEIEGGEPDVH